MESKRETAIEKAWKDLPTVPLLIEMDQVMEGVSDPRHRNMQMVGLGFRKGYLAGVASVSRKEVVREAFTKVALELGRGELPEPNEFYYATSLATAMEKVLAEMEDNDAN